METSTNDLLTTLQVEIKALRKDLRKVKQLLEDPSGEKAKARATNNGFNKPLDVSEKLRAFLKLGVEDKVSRSQVTKLINEYVTEKGLKAGQQITLDASLQDLLAPPAGTQITFLNIQKYINPHYIKPVAEPKAPKEPKTLKEKKPAAVIPETPVSATPLVATPSVVAPAAPAVATEKPKVARPLLKKPAAPVAK
jgi:upstream activation factor subunit UAF30